MRAALSRSALAPHYANTQPISDIHQGRSIIVIKNKAGTYTGTPSHIQIDGLTITRAHPQYSFTDAGGAVKNYIDFGAAIWIDRGHHITIADNEISDSQMAVFSKSTDDGSFAVTRDIRIAGNKVFSESRLLELFELTPSGWFTWYTKRDQYARQKLSGDLETLRSFYYNRGYLDFSVESTQVSITPDRERIHIAVAMTEGPVYTTGTVKFSGELLVPVVHSLPGEPVRIRIRARDVAIALSVILLLATLAINYLLTSIQQGGRPR